MTAWERYLRRQEEDRLRRLLIVKTWATVAHDTDLEERAKAQIQALAGEPA